jgi:hypothetical protein
MERAGVHEFIEGMPPLKLEEGVTAVEGVNGGSEGEETY